MFTLMCINFHVSNCKSKFQVGFSKYKRLLISSFQCELLVSSKCQVGFYKKEIEFCLMIC
jgi:hypothetical protein